MITSRSAHRAGKSSRKFKIGLKSRGCPRRSSHWVASMQNRSSLVRLALLTSSLVHLSLSKKPTLGLIQLDRGDDCLNRSGVLKNSARHTASEKAKGRTNFVQRRGRVQSTSYSVRASVVQLRGRRRTQDACKWEVEVSRGTKSELVSSHKSNALLSN